MSTYKPAIGQINFNVSSYENIQNLFNVIPGFSTLPQPTDESVTPLSIAQYALYSIEKEDENFGVEDAIYLGYKGGFITQGNKLNIKQGNFNITNNLTVRKQTRFNKNIDLSNNRITNLIRKGSLQNSSTISQFVNSVYNTKQNDNDAMTVGDMREFRFVKGTVMMWSGSYASLVDNLPLWRLCAPPDSDTTPVNGVTVPNLEGRFILAGGYSNVTGGNVYQPKFATYQNTTITSTQNFGGSINLNIGTTGGFNTIALTLQQIPVHNHGISFEKTENTGQLSINSNRYGNLRNGSFTYFRKPINNEGEVTVSTRNSNDECVSRENFSCNNPCGGGRLVCSVNLHPGTFSLKSVKYGTTVNSTPNVVDAPVTSTISDIFVGNTLSHDNRPPFIVLGYIIYVGVKR